MDLGGPRKQSCAALATTGSPVHTSVHHSHRAACGLEPCDAPILTPPDCSKSPVLTNGRTTKCDTRYSSKMTNFRTFILFHGETRRGAQCIGRCDVLCLGLVEDLCISGAGKSTRIDVPRLPTLRVVATSPLTPRALLQRPRGAVVRTTSPPAFSARVAS